MQSVPYKVGGQAYQVLFNPTELDPMAIDQRLSEHPPVHIHSTLLNVFPMLFLRSWYHHVNQMLSRFSLIVSQVGVLHMPFFHKSQVKEPQSLSNSTTLLRNPVRFLMECLEEPAGLEFMQQLWLVVSSTHHCQQQSWISPFSLLCP